MTLGAEDEEVPEDLQDKILAAMTGRKMSQNASYFAFTATPKPATLEKFGRQGQDGKFYASQAGKTLAGIADKLRAAGDRGGKDEVRFVLGEDARSWSKASLNGWQAAMYRTLVESDWFCGEGYAYAGEKHKREE